MRKIKFRLHRKLFPLSVAHLTVIFARSQTKCASPVLAFIRINRGEPSRARDRREGEQERERMLSECRRSPPRTGMHGTQMSVITDAAPAASPPPKFHASLPPSLPPSLASLARLARSSVSLSPPLGESLFNLLEVFLQERNSRTALRLKLEG